ncbi:RNA polymerase sigma factor [Sedimenticola sp.]|uniref:RNA polymerase sigma factor n=1 Tax=Sedimenticola sp. TaxID=1940285 RepID=UPI003D0FB090
MNSSEAIDSFLALRDQLRSFVFRLLPQRQDAEDIVQETYIRVRENIESFREESSFRTWVFSIALNLSKNHLNKQRRWEESSQDYGAMLHTHSAEHWVVFRDVFDATPYRNYEIREHIAYCLICINKTLLVEQQVCLLLKEIYEFKVSEIMRISGLSEGKVKHAIADARRNMIRIFDERCSFVSKRGRCDQCTALKGILNPEQDAQVEANKIALVRQGDSPDREYLLDLRLELTRSIDPLNSPNTRLNTFMLENRDAWVEEGKKRNVLEVRPKSTAHLSK